MSQFSVANVRRYYDRHTRSFIRFGQVLCHRIVRARPITARGSRFLFAFDCGWIAGDLRRLRETRRHRRREASYRPLGDSRFDYLTGASALQECLARGWIGYDFIVFRRV